MQVTSPKGWTSLLVMVALLLVAVVWGFFGSIPTAASGDGMLLRRGGVTTVVAAGSGQLETLMVEVGDAVNKGQVVARLRQEGIERQIEDVLARKAALTEELELLERYAASQIRLSVANEEQKRSSLERSIVTLERRRELLEKNLTVQEELLVDGLVTQQTVLGAEQKLDQARDQLAEQRLQLESLKLTRLQSQQELDQQLEARRTQMRDLNLELREKQASLEESMHVIATEDGKVLELLVDKGSVVGPGTPVLSMEVESDNLMAVLFVPVELGKQIVPGMPARISPSTATVEEFGYLLGEVQWVSEFPSTAAGMERLLGNQELVGELMSEGPPIRVDVKLLKDENTETGFRWSSRRGPQVEITSGTLASGSVIVRDDIPISLVVPLGRPDEG